MNLRIIYVISSFTRTRRTVSPQPQVIPKKEIRLVLTPNCTLHSEADRMIPAYGMPLGRGRAGPIIFQRMKPRCVPIGEGRV